MPEVQLEEAGVRRAAKRDANEREIIDALLAAGCDVIQCDEIDLLVGRAGMTFALEVKQPDKRNDLRDTQIRLIRDWRGHYAVVTTPDEALRAVGLMGADAR